MPLLTFLNQWKQWIILTPSRPKHKICQLYKYGLLYIQYEVTFIFDSSRIWWSLYSRLCHPTLVTVGAAQTSIDWHCFTVRIFFFKNKFAGRFAYRTNINIFSCTNSILIDRWKINHVRVVWETLQCVMQYQYAMDSYIKCVLAHLTRMGRRPAALLYWGIAQTN